MSSLYWWARVTARHKLVEQSSRDAHVQRQSETWRPVIDLCPWAPVAVLRGKAVRMIIYPQFLTTLAGVQLHAVEPLHVDGMFPEDRLKLKLPLFPEPKLMVPEQEPEFISKHVEMQTTREVLRALMETLEENKNNIERLTEEGHDERRVLTKALTEERKKTN